MELRRNLFLLAGISIVLLVVILSILADYIAPFSYDEAAGAPLSPPNPVNLMGTDNLGYDVWSRIVYGSRTVLFVVLSSIILSAALGIPLGLVSGYIGGKLDKVLSFIMDSIYAFPSLVLAITLAVVLGPSPINAAIAIAIVYVPTYFRMVRGQVLSVKTEPFIEVSRALGLPVARILFKHILPHVGPTVMVVFSLSSTDAVLTEAALSFLGLSVQPPTPDWGYELYKGKGFLLSGAWWMVFFPGLMITLLAMGFALMSEGLSRGEREVV
ncbi:MAG: ABC transporter permease [Candidatus Korarchaeum sp.]